MPPSGSLDSVSALQQTFGFSGKETSVTVGSGRREGCAHSFRVQGTSCQSQTEDLCQLSRCGLSHVLHDKLSWLVWFQVVFSRSVLQQLSVANSLYAPPIGTRGVPRAAEACCRAWAGVTILRLMRVMHVAMPSLVEVQFGVGYQDPLTAK